MLTFHNEAGQLINVLEETVSNVLRHEKPGLVRLVIGSLEMVVQGEFEKFQAWAKMYDVGLPTAENPPPFSDGSHLPLLKPDADNPPTPPPGADMPPANVGTSD